MRRNRTREGFPIELKMILCDGLQLRSSSVVSLRVLFGANFYKYSGIYRSSYFRFPVLRNNARAQK